MINPFRPAELASDGFQMARPITQPGLFGARLTMDYGYRTMPSQSAPAPYDIVNHQLTGTLALSFRVHDRITLGGALPISLLMRGQTPTAGATATADGTLPGDFYVYGRFRIFGNEGDRFILGAQAKVTIPTADGADNTQRFTGDQSLTFAPQLLGEINANSRLRFNFAVGARLRHVQRQDVRLYVGQELTYSLAATYAVVPDRLDLTAEVYGSTDYGYYPRNGNNPTRPGGLNSPMEGIIGANFRPATGWHVGAAVGTQIIAHGYGTAVFRGILTASYVMGETPRAEPEPPPPPPENPDRDGDGVLNADDGCPDEAEDMDGWQDENGCPDVDNDGDGILDAVDASPNDPEDVDGFEDENGTPDLDNDNDGVPDTSDSCPMDPEDMDGVADENGCPETDADGDSVLDADDHCPMTPGIINATNPECSGCPAAACIDSSGTIRILQRIEFETNSEAIKAESSPVLEAVLEIMQTSATIRRVLIEGHTDDRGNDNVNMELSQRRATSVAAWLVQHGVDATRLEFIGMGETRPLIAGHSRAARAANRRVEFHITDPAPPPEAAPEPAPVPAPRRGRPVRAPRAPRAARPAR